MHPDALGPRPPRDALTRAAPWIAAVALALPVLVYRYPPMFDLPCHEEIVGAMRHFGDPRFYPPGLMTWNLGHANQLFYFLAWPLAYVVPTDLACKLVVAASVAGTPLAAARLADHVGATRWVAVAIAPLALGFAFYFGFVGNVLGLALFLAFLPRLDDFARAPSVRGMGLAIVALALLFFAHEAALVLGCMAIVVLSVPQPLRARETALRVAPLVVALFGLAAEHASAIGARGPNLAGLPTVIDLAAWQKLEQIPEALLGRHGDVTTRPAFLALMLAILFPAILRARRGLARLEIPRDVRAFLDAQRFAILGVVYLVAYFEVPFAVTGAMWLHARFLAPGVAVLAIAIAPRADAPRSIVARLLSLAAVGAMLALLRPEFEATSALYRDLDPLLARIEPGSAVAHVDLVGGPLRNLVFSVGGAAARAGAERGGRMAISFTQSTPIPPVVIAQAHRWDSAFLRIAREGLRPALDLQRFRYVLAWTFPGQAELLTRAMAPEGKLVARSGGWLLYESTLDVASPMADEPPVANEATVGERYRALARTPR